VLTQIGFLASNAGAFENDPIHRGVFMNLQLLCTGLPPPPNVVPPLPPPIEGETLRERIDAHTGKGTCGEGCHGYLINPIGFAFENYDPLGEWQTMDAGKPSTPPPSSCSAAAPRSLRRRRRARPPHGRQRRGPPLLRRHLLEYGYARKPKKADDRVIERIAAGSQRRHPLDQADHPRADQERRLPAARPGGGVTTMSRTQMSLPSRLPLRPGGIAVGLPFLEGLRPRKPARRPRPSARASPCSSARPTAAPGRGRARGFWPHEPRRRHHRDPLHHRRRPRRQRARRVRRQAAARPRHPFAFPGNGCGHSGGGNQVLTAAEGLDDPMGNKSLAMGESVDNRIARELNPPPTPSR
jgi:hypothetical protein